VDASSPAAHWIDAKLLATRRVYPAAASRFPPFPPAATLRRVRFEIGWGEHGGWWLVIKWASRQWAVGSGSRRFTYPTLHYSPSLPTAYSLQRVRKKPPCGQSLRTKRRSAGGDKLELVMATVCSLMPQSRGDGLVRPTADEQQFGALEPLHCPRRRKCSICLAVRRPGLLPPNVGALRCGRCWHGGPGARPAPNCCRATGRNQRQHRPAAFAPQIIDQLGGGDRKTGSFQRPTTDQKLWPWLVQKAVWNCPLSPRFLGRGARRVA